MNGATYVPTLATAVTGGSVTAFSTAPVLTSRVLLGGTLYQSTGVFTVKGAGIHNVTSASTDWAGSSAIVTFDGVTDNFIQIQRRLLAGHDYELPDGSKITLDGAGNYKIDDASGKVVYEANWHRGFNRYVNASDLVGEFIEALAALHATRDQALKAPLGLFITWLIHEAARQDGEEPPDDTPAIETAAAPIVRPRCLDCGRFLGPNQRRIGLRFCTGAHADRYLKRIAAP